MHSKPGLWLQLAALLGVAGTLLTVVSGTIGFSHEEISALAVPPLRAKLRRVAHRGVSVGHDINLPQAHRSRATAFAIDQFRRRARIATGSG